MNSHDPIVWSDEFVTGIPEIDDQHRVLVKTFNDAGIRLSGNRDASLMDQITRDLLSYAIYHFETEESLMEEHGYFELHSDDASHHKQQHRSFSANVVDIREGLKKGRPISREGLLSFLNSWLVGHIMSTDKKLAAHIVSRRI